MLLTVQGAKNGKKRSPKEVRKRKIQENICNKRTTKAVIKRKQEGLKKKEKKTSTGNVVHKYRTK